MSTSSPEQVVQRQLDAYNRRDIDAFVACYAEGLEVFQFPNALSYRGLARFREDYAELFTKHTELRCSVQHRVLIGERVIDHELVTGVGERPIRCVAIYEITDGLIQRLWFIS